MTVLTSHLERLLRNDLVDLHSVRINIKVLMLHSTHLMPCLRWTAVLKLKQKGRTVRLNMMDSSSVITWRLGPGEVRRMPLRCACWKRKMPPSVMFAWVKKLLLRCTFWRKEQATTASLWGQQMLQQCTYKWRRRSRGVFRSKEDAATMSFWVEKRPRRCTVGWRRCCKDVFSVEKMLQQCLPKWEGATTMYLLTVE